MSGILQSESLSMLTSIENNIRCHFIEYLNRFVNVLLKNQYINADTDSESLKKLNKEMSAVKNDLLYDRQPTEYKSDLKYHSWIQQHRDLMLPNLEKKERLEKWIHENISQIPKEFEKRNNVYYDIKLNPQKYLKHMIYMNLKIEEYQREQEQEQEQNDMKHQLSMFQFFPLRTEIVPKYISIDISIID